PVYAVDKVEVVAGSIYTLQVKLTLQQQSTTVEVSAAALTLDTTTQTQNMTIASDVVQDVPLNGRDFTQLVATAPGYGGYSVGGFGSLNGTRPNQMNWQIDGVDNNDFWHNIPAVNQGGVSGIAGVVLPIDSIEEFSSQTQSGAEAGRNAGGTVNLITKSGGNTLHGSVYYYNRNEFYSAKSPFFTPAPGTKAPPLRNQNYGFQVNGPIRKDKAFYLVSFEKQQYIIGLSGVATEPSDAWVTLATDLLNNPGNKYGSYSPISPSSVSATLIGPTGFWPRSGSGSIAGLSATNNNFFSPIASIGHSYNGVAKVDYNFNDKHRLSLRWFGGQGDQTAPLGGSPALGTASSNLKYYFEDAPIHVYNYSLTLNSVFTSRMTNQVLVGANYFNQTFSDFNNSFDTKAMGLFLSPDAAINGKPIHGAPNIVIGNFEQIGLTPPEGRSDLTWHATDIVSYNRGAHQFRFGGEVRQAHVNEFYHRRGTGKFVFDGLEGPWSGATGCGSTTPTAACTGLLGTNAATNVLANAEALADYLAGDVSTCTVPVGQPAKASCGSTIAVGNPERWVVVNAYNFYFQDSWQATKRLNLNFGMRYEYFGPLHSSKKDIAVFIPGKGLIIQGNGIDSIFPPDRNNFAPRIGFAYQATSRGDLVVRGGIGVFYDQINMNPFLDFRPPITASQGIEGNAFGPSPVSTYSLSGYNWGSGVGQAQAGGASIFPGVQKCTDSNCAAAGDPKGLSAYSVNQNFRTPYFYNFDLQVEKSLGSAAVLQVGYVGSEGRKLNIVTNINAGGAFPNFGNILQLNSIGTSNYNSLQSTFRIRTWHGLSSQFGYTWSHALDEISEYRATIADAPNNIKLDYGNGDYDTRHLFTANITYLLPKAGWATGWADKLVNGWQLSSLWVLHRGQPYDITRSGKDLIGDPFAGLSHSFSKSIPGIQWINPAAFCTPGAVGCTGPTNPDGNVARNRFVGPSYKSVDFSVLKNVPITERVRVQLRAEMFNLFNRINFASGPGSVNGDGTVTDTIGDFNGAPGIGPGEPFNMQLALKIIF
ncbi:MAG: TonB-dependent receptor plug, partial [Candidatus Acidoferrum typicum]|nr:TonB-dependent receptor plug [Candidatus Acidoferrum typicum]